LLVHNPSTPNFQLIFSAFLQAPWIFFDLYSSACFMILCLPYLYVVAHYLDTQFRNILKISFLFVVFRWCSSFVTCSKGRRNLIVCFPFVVSCFFSYWASLSYYKVVSVATFCIIIFVSDDICLPKCSSKGIFFFLFVILLPNPLFDLRLVI